MGANPSVAERPQTPSRTSSLSRFSHAYILPDESAAKDKKKKTSKFATLRKKFTRVRRHSRSMDYSKALREFTSTWSSRELSALVEEYEALAALKELALAANAARPAASTFRRDLSNLFDHKYCTDLDLVYRGACFPCHRAILSVRSPFFRHLLSKYPHYGSQVPVKLKTHNVDVPLFSALLRYLYTDELNTSSLQLENEDILLQLVDECGMPNPLDQDLRTLLETGDYSDAVLVFTNESDCHDFLLPEAAVSENRPIKNELRCHKAILAARSPFFRSMLLRRARTGVERTDRSLQSATRIVLDENIIPRQYARVLLHAIYQDVVDLSCIVRSSVSMCSLSEAQAMVSGKGHMTHADEAMEIYQIGQFLDLPILSQGCEDIIADSVSVETLVTVLTWSSEPHGSRWVHRQAIHFLCDEFLQVVHSPQLYDLAKEYLIIALRSDFLQAGELEILSAVLKWGEHQLVKRMEEREPNLLSHTAHSVSKKGVKKRDLNDEELRDTLQDLLAHVRLVHIIPYNNDILMSAIRRGVVSTPPSHMIGDDGNSQRVYAWIRGKNNGMFVKPRLFTPHFEEAKVMFEEQLSQYHESEARVRMVHMSAIPDTLYMVESKAYPRSYPPPGSSRSTVDIIAGTIPVPDRTTLLLMQSREQELQMSKPAQRAYSMPCSDKRAISYYIHLRVVRELGLPDTTVEILQGGHYPHQAEVRYMEQPQPCRQAVPSRSHVRNAAPRLRLQHTSMSPARHKHSPTTSTSPTHSYNTLENDSSICSETVLNDMIPDIAMATASVGQMHIHDNDLELDIGDGSSHHGTLYI